MTAPTAPTSTGDETSFSPQPPPPPPQPRPSSGGAWSWILVSVGMILVGLAIGWLVFSSPGQEAAASTATTTATTTTGAGSQVAPPLQSTDEPVADVAKALLPSVVQIETPAGALGSGVIYDSNGLILTAAHVVDGQSQVRVRLSDGTQYSGTVVGQDDSFDIGVVRIDATGLPAASLATDTQPEVGQLAVAIGSPFGLDSTVTSGVVSAVNQSVPENGRYRSLIQTDAAINPGNSGGALANRQGQVIGINVSIFSTSGGNNGIGFAVPIGVGKQVADSIVSGQPLSMAVLGVQGADAQTGPAGALITGVQPQSGAAKAGLQVGDVVTAVDGVQVNGIGDLAGQIQNHQPGDKVKLDVLRGGQTLTLEATLGSS
ncbi:MAG: trypsin-like peptidase domain-containing protein [Acidimicrobiia bacterium]